MTNVEIASLVLSALALFISALSWHESRASRQLSRATSRAVLHLRAARMLTVMRGGGELHIDVENAGNALAKNVSLFHKTLTFLGEEDRKRTSRMHFETEGTDEISPIPPGRALAHPIIFELPPDGLADSWPTLVWCSVRVAYTDEATGEQFLETQHFTAVVTGKEIITKEMARGGPPTPHMLRELVPEPRTGLK